MESGDRYWHRGGFNATIRDAKMEVQQDYGAVQEDNCRSPSEELTGGVGVDSTRNDRHGQKGSFDVITMRFIFDMGIDLDAIPRGPLLLMADQASLVCVALAVMHCVAGFDSNAVSCIEYSAPWAGDNDVVVL